MNQETAGTLEELIDLLIKEKKPIGREGLVLKNGIPRPDYYILHENVKVIKKIGGGAFGEVFTGVLTIKNELELSVAVKKIKGQVTKSQVEEFIKVI